MLLIGAPLQGGSLKGTESWTPLCLPRFNAGGYLYSYVGYLDPTADLCLLLVSAQPSPDTFLTFQTWKAAIAASLEREGVLQAVRQATALAQRPGHSDDRFLSAHAQAAAQAAAVAAAQPANAARTAAAVIPSPWLHASRSSRVVPHGGVVRV